MNENKSKLKDGFLKIVDVMRQPILATIFGLVVGAIVIMTSSENPLGIYKIMFQKSFFEFHYLIQTLTRSTPIMICGIATAAAWRAGYINIGVEGQMIFGGFAAAICSIYMPGPAIIVLPVSIIVGMIVGGFYAWISGALFVRYRVPIVISTLMMNYIASNITSYFVSFPFKDLSGDGLASQTVMIDDSLKFLRLIPRTSFNIAFFMALIIVILFYYMERYTVFGYESKMTGLNPNFARYGGVKEKRVIYKTMFLSGAIAALAGVAEIYGVKYRFIDGMFTSTSYAWTGLMTALIANLHPIGIAASSIFLAGLQVGGQSIQRVSSIPVEMATLIQCCITLFVSVKGNFGMGLSKRILNRLRPEERGEEVEG